MSDPVVAGDIDNLRSHLLRLKGSDEKPGHYFYQDGNKWYSCTLETLKHKQEQLRDEWESHCKIRESFGDPRPTKWPPHLQEKQDRLSAKRIVALEEIEWLE